jgi:hypothetical protein
MATTRKRIMVVALAVALAALGTYGWMSGTATFEMLRLIMLGVALAVVYIARGGTLPAVAHRVANVLSDDDPRNLPPRIYLPILCGAILIATLMYAWVVYR